MSLRKAIPTVIKMRFVYLKGTLFLGLALLLISASQSGSSQTKSKATASPSPTPATQESDQERVRVFTEEVRLPIVALDAYGHYDPTLEPDDVLVLEDGVAQQIRSVRHLPANVVFLLDTGGESSGLGGISKSTSLTRQVASDLIQRLQEGSWIDVVQSGNSTDVVQPWTQDKQAVIKTLKTKLLATKRSRFSDSIVTAAQQLSNRPEGSRHVVMITDGVDSPGGKTDRAVAIKKLVAARATIHIISYTEFVRQKGDEKSSKIATGQRPTSSDPITATDPTLPPGTTRSPSFGVAIRFDPAMRRLRKAYESEVRKSQEALTNLADETGGKIYLPVSSDEMRSRADEVARAIEAEYVVTYRPTRPLSEARPGEYRKIDVTSRRVGVSLYSRRGYVVPSE
ncbi:MAG TPA: VWA domain-containing protein [Pyrinomonadaceae bacterium]|nr:VWA domain-containing protein [Pyrinomonadaceae bacterium]